MHVRFGYKAESTPKTNSSLLHRITAKSGMAVMPTDTPLIGLNTRNGNRIVQLN